MSVESLRAYYVESGLFDERQRDDRYVDIAGPALVGTVYKGMSLLRVLHLALDQKESGRSISEWVIVAAGMNFNRRRKDAEVFARCGGRSLIRECHDQEAIDEGTVNALHEDNLWAMRNGLELPHRNVGYEQVMPGILLSVPKRIGLFTPLTTRVVSGNRDIVFTDTSTVSQEGLTKIWEAA